MNNNDSGPSPTTTQPVETVGVGCIKVFCCHRSSKTIDW